jgi:hypothetical protein
MDDACLLAEDPAELAGRLDSAGEALDRHWQRELDRALRGLPLDCEKEE